MVSQMQQVVVKYMERVQQKSYVPRFSNGRGLLRDDGGPNTFEYFASLCHVTPRTIAARLADCERSSLSFWALHWPFLLHGLWLE